MSHNFDTEFEERLPSKVWDRQMLKLEVLTQRIKVNDNCIKLTLVPLSNIAAVPTNSNHAPKHTLPRIARPVFSTKNEAEEAIYANTSNNHFIAMSELKQFVRDMEADKDCLIEEFKVSQHHAEP